jgi:UDP-N-acetylmuramoyl-L-alanyl-D-glutamate--2,6-diaminopimelate ligase
MDSNLIFKSLGYLKPARGRMEVLSETTNNGLVIIDYAHSPDALTSALKSIQEITDRGRIITLFGCGGDRDKDKRQIMGELADKYSDLVIVTDDNPRNEPPAIIRKEILIGCPSATEIPNRDKAIKYAVSNLQENDLLLIAGKGHETFQALGIETLPFDDYTVAKEAIKNIEKSEVIN